MTTGPFRSAFAVSFCSAFIPIAMAWAWLLFLSSAGAAASIPSDPASGFCERRDDIRTTPRTELEKVLCATLQADPRSMRVRFHWIPDKPEGVLIVETAASDLENREDLGVTKLRFLCGTSAEHLRNCTSARIQNAKSLGVGDELTLLSHDFVPQSRRIRLLLDCRSIGSSPETHGRLGWSYRIDFEYSPALQQWTIAKSEFPANAQCANRSRHGF